MAAVEQQTPEWQRDVEHELTELRQGILTTFAVVAVAVAWLWFTYATVAYGALGREHMPSIVLMASSIVVFVLRKRHYSLACWVFLLSSGVALGQFLAPGPMALIALAAGVVTIIAANALVGGVGSLAIAVLLSTFGIVGLRGSLWPDGVQLVLFFAFTGAAAWLTMRPLRTSVALTYAGWHRAADAVAEARTRRGELYRVMRALEEATYRIERMNNELLVARREAEEALALKARFVATVSHELRSPLNLILGFSRLMALSPERYDAPLPSSYRADIDAIYRNSQHLAALVDDILDLSQIEAQRMPLVKDRIELEEDVVKRAVSIVRPLAERKGLYIRLDLAGNLPWLLADPVRLRQALLNLLTNAIRFTQQGGITLRTVLRDQEILVSVSDTGPGISAEEMPKLFREFQQIHVTDKRDGQGSGLGLSISKYLLELHGGQIWAESVPDKGTTFHFTVPLPGGAVRSQGLIETRELEPATRKMKTCLIVHDEPGIIRVLARHIDGYRVVGLPDEHEVQSLTEGLHPTAVITSPEHAPRIAQLILDTHYDVPVIACELPRAREQGAVGRVLEYLIKPVAPEAIADVMKRVEKTGETTVLLVDDDADAVRLIESMLTALPRPYKILRAFDGQQALEIMNRVVPDVLFIDLMMPGLDGTRTVAALQRDERLRQVPVVVISGRDWIEQTAMLGTDLHVSCGRPLDIAKAAGCLRALMETLEPSYLPSSIPPEPSSAEAPH